MMLMSLIPPALQWFAAAVFGLIFGSFLNVCIVRLPRGESIVRPSSHCPQCLRSIPWYDNIPLLSYTILSGHCRFCRNHISILYPVVEGMTACLFLVAFDETASSWAFAKAVIFGMVMIVLIFTDLLERIIPHSVTVFGIVAGLAFSLFYPMNDSIIDWFAGRMGWSVARPLASFAGSLLGALFGGGTLLGVAWLLKRLSHETKEYLGFGDVMLMFVVGAFWGIPLTYLTILLGSLAGSLVAVMLTLINRRFRAYQWPYGSFLGVAAICVSFWGRALLASYLAWQGLR
jgi:leader peptidase (prepilin peptidase) / N-methyltransferase